MVEEGFWLGASCDLNEAFMGLTGSYSAKGTRNFFYSRLLSLAQGCPKNPQNWGNVSLGTRYSPVLHHDM